METAATGTTTNPPTFVHETAEDNLQAARHTLKRLRAAMLVRKVLGDDEEVDVLVGGDVVERHVFKKRRPFRIEETALYR